MKRKSPFGTNWESGLTLAALYNEVTGKSLYNRPGRKLNAEELLVLRIELEDKYKENNLIED